MILLLVTFFLFHLPNGQPIYIVRDHVVAVTPAVGAAPGAHTQLITLANIPTYLSETPDEVVKVLSAGE